MLELGVKFLISYFIGSLMGAIIVGKLRGGVDIREMGSGNAGGTNALRTQGALFALGVVIIDIGKGVIGAGVIPLLNLPFVPQESGAVVHSAASGLAQIPQFLKQVALTDGAVPSCPGSPSWPEEAISSSYPFLEKYPNGA